MTIVGFYTRGTPYEAEAELLKASLKQTGHRQRKIVGIDNRGDWYDNTRYKARFLQAMREEIEGPLLYVDVDAFFHANVAEYFEGLAAQGFDYGAHWFKGPSKGHDRSEMRSEGWWMLSGTLFLGDTPGARELLGHWVALNDLFSTRGIMQGGGQKNLWYTVTCLDHLKVKALPGRYCYVFDKGWAYPAGEPCVIEHTIASRDNRAEIRQTVARHNRIAELRALVA